MNTRMILRTLGQILQIFAALLLLPLGVSLLYRESPLPLLIPLSGAAVVGLALSLLRPKTTAIYARDGFVIVGLGWILISLLGALPFSLSGSLPTYVDALFESVSGLSTTGATVATDLTSMPRGVMFWRLFSHWIGGMGVLVFLMAVLPMSGKHSMHIFRAEVPGPTKGKLVPRARQTARVLYTIYIVLTLLETIFLLCGGMSFYDAILHAFATAGTGGFSTISASIAGFGSRYIETVVAVFMLLFGVNFNLYLRRRPGAEPGAAKDLRRFCRRLPPGLLQRQHHHEHHGLRHGGLHDLAGVRQVDPGAADVLRRLRGQHQRRHEALPPDDPLQDRDCRTAADGAAPERAAY